MNHISKRRNQHDPIVTVIILHYKTVDLTIACVNSCLQSTYPSYDILVFDNGSNDGSYEILKARFEQSSRVTIASCKKNYGFTGGFNRAARIATGEKIILLSNDMEVDPEWIVPLVERSVDAKSIVQPKILQFYHRNHLDNVGGSYSWFGIGRGVGHGELDRRQYDTTDRIDYATATTLMIDRNFFLELGGYDEWFWSHYEDVDLCARAKKAGGTFHLAPRSKIYHKISKTYERHVSASQTRFHIRKNMIRVVLKNYQGAEKYIRLILISLLFIGLLISDLMQNKRTDCKITLAAISSAFRSPSSAITGLSS